MQRPIKAITSFFYLGFSPFMPGTIGSLGGLIVYLLVKNNIVLYGFSLLFLVALGIIFSAEAEKIYKQKDARMIVIDEACGMLLALFFVRPSVLSIVLGFLLFRIFDILKPPPARRVEKMSGSLGVMLDDIIAAIYTNITLQIITRLCIKA